MSSQTSQYLKRIGALIAILAIFVSFVPAEIVFAEDNSLSVEANDSGEASVSIWVAPGEGTVLTANASADDTEGLTYRWYSYKHINNPWADCIIEEYPDVTGNEFVIPAGEGFRRDYYCEVTDKYGNSCTAYFAFFVDNNLEFTISDTGSTDIVVNLNQGEGTTLRTEAHANEEDGLTYWWFVDEYDTSGNWISGSYLEESSNELYVVSDGKIKDYRCEVRDKYMNAADVYFHVRSQNDLIVTANDSGESSVSVRLAPGEGTVLIANVSANDQEGLTYRWYGNVWLNNEWNNIDYTDVTGNEFIIPAGEAARADYYCQVNDKYGNSCNAEFSIWIENNLWVTVNDTEDSDVYLRLYPGEETTLRVIAYADEEDGLTYTWYVYDVDSNGNWMNDTVLDETGNELNIVTDGTAKDYRCNVTDKYENNSNAYFRIRTQNDLSVTANDSGESTVDIQLAPGEGTVLRANVSANEMEGLTYRWYSDTLVNGDWVYEEYSEVTGNELIIAEGGTLSKNYICEVRDKYGNNCYAHFNVSIDNDLRVTVNDTESSDTTIYLSSGEGTTLRVNASANEQDGLTYRWFAEEYDINGNWLSGAFLEDAGDELYVVMDGSRKGYRCYVTDKYWNSRQVSFSIRIQTDLSVTANDSGESSVDIQLAPGEGTVLKVNASASDPEGLTYRWYAEWTKNAEWSSEEYPDVTGNELVIPAGEVVRKDYRCEVRDKYGNSCYAYFYVSVDNGLQVTVDGDESNSTVIYLNPSEGTTLKVNARANNEDGLTYKWLVDESDANGNWIGWSTLEGTGKEQYVVFDGTVRDYRCIVTDKYWNSWEAYFHVRMQNNLIVTANDSGEDYVNIRLVPGDGTVLRANASANDMEGMTYRWYSDTYLNGEWINEEYPDVTGNEYVIPTGEAARKDYHCEVRDKFGNNCYAHFYVSIENGLQVRANDTDSWDIVVNLVPGEGTTLRAEAHANDEDGLTYTWHVDEYDTNGNWIDGSFLEDTGSELYVLMDGTVKDYRCTVYDKYGNSESAYFRIRFQNDLIVTANDSGVTSVSILLAPGEGTVLRANASASDLEGLTYRWYSFGYKNGVWTTEEYPDVTGNEYIIPEGEALRKDYQCEVRDRYGNNCYISFNVSIENGLWVRANDTDSNDIVINPDLGETITLRAEIHANEEDGLTYWWYSHDVDSNGNWLSETVLGETGNELSVVFDGTAKDYCCTVIDKYGNNVDAYFRIRIQNNLSVTANDSGETYVNIQLMPGEGTVLRANASANDSEGLTYRWTSNTWVNGEWVYKEYPDITGNEYLIPDGETVIGDYYCEVSDKYSNRVWAQFHVYIENGLWVSANDTDSSDIIVNLVPGEETTLTVNAYANDEEGLTYRWYSHEVDIYGNWINETVLGETGNELSVVCDGTSEDYCCVVEDKYGNSAYAYFRIRFQNDLTVTANDSGGRSVTIQLTPGEGTVLRANATANDMDGLTYRWWSDIYENGEWIYKEYPEVTGNEFAIPAEEVIRGSYYCEVRDKYGSSAYVDFYVNIENELSVKANENSWGDASVSVLAGEGTILTVHASAKDTQGITYRWYIRDNVTYQETEIDPSNTSRTVLEIPLVEQSAEYRCVVTDRYGNSANAWFNVRVDNHLSAKDKETGYHEVKIELSPGESRTLEVEFSALDTLGITTKWEKRIYNSDGWYSTEEIPDYAGMTKLTLTDIAEHTGYNCRVIDRFGNTSQVGYEISVNHLEVTADGSSDSRQTVKVAPGESVRLALTVTADNYNGIVFSWDKGEYDEYGYNYQQTETLPDDSNFIVVDNVSHHAVYRCVITDAFGSRIQMFFEVIPENHLVVTADGRELPETGRLYLNKAVRRGNDLTLTVEADADDITDLSFVWQGDGEVSTGPSSSTYTVHDVEDAFEVYCTVTDRYGNTRRVRFWINVDETIERYIGTETAEKLNGLDSCFNVFQAGDTYTVTIAPCKTEAEINALLGNGITTSDLYYWMVYRRPIDSIDVDYLAKAANGIGALVKNISIVDQNMIQYSLGIKLCVDSDESADDYYNCCDYLTLYPCTYKDVITCVDGPSDHLSFNFGAYSLKEAEFWDSTYFNIDYENPGIPFDGVFDVRYIREEGTCIITPLVTKEEYIASSGDSADTIYAIEAGLSINNLIFDESFGDWEAVFSENSNVCGTGAGGGPNFSGTGMAILAWTENDLTFIARGTAPSGERFIKTIKVITHAEPAGIAAPELKAISSTSTGVKISWEKSVGAAKYRVYRKEGSGDWNAIADVGDVATYTDTTAVAGTKYSYTVCCLSSDGTTTVSTYDADGITITFIAAPVLKSATNAATGVTVNWVKSKGATNYRVFRKEGTGSWKRLADVGNVATYTDTTAVAGTKYAYTVRCIGTDGSYTSAYDSTGITITYIAAPVLKSAASKSAGVVVDWTKSKGATNYRVFRKEGTGSWKKLADVGNVATYTDTTAVGGTKYTYTVRCIGSDGSYTSAYDTTGITVTYITAPVLKSVTSTADGVTVNWAKSKGATNYRVFRKEGSGSWKKLADVGNVATYTDTTAVAGTKYAYTVRCIGSDGSYVSAYDSTGLTVTYIKAPVLDSATSTATGVTVTWTKSKGATNYRVFRKEDSGSWKKIADVGNVATYTDTTAVAGTKYTYTVRCIGSDGSYKSAYDTTGITVTYIAAPVLKSVTGTSDGVTVTWTKSKGATNYRVFRKEGTGSWKKLADVGNVATYTDKTAVSGTKYTYTVRCISADGKTYMSAYDTTGKTITYKK